MGHRSHKDRQTEHLPAVTMGKAQHASEDDYEFVRKKKAKPADTKRYYSGVDAGMISRMVMGAMGGPETFALAAMGEFTPGLMKDLGAIPGAVLNHMEGHGAKPTR